MQLDTTIGQRTTYLADGRVPPFAFHIRAWLSSSAPPWWHRMNLKRISSFIRGQENDPYQSWLPCSSLVFQNAGAQYLWPPR